MSALPSSPRDRLRHLLTVPPEQSEHAWPHIWRTLAVTLAGLVAVSLALGLVATLLVAAPHAIATGRLGTTCVSTDTLDCTRALADARQSVLFSAGGLIALVGIVFTYLRWRAERDSTDEALEEGKRATKRLEREGERHERDADQLEITRITDALGLLESTDAAKRTAAVSLLIDYAIYAGQPRYTRLILDVLLSFLAHEEQDGVRVADDLVTNERLPLSPAASQALTGILRISYDRCVEVHLSSLTIVGFEAPDSQWNYVRLRNIAFIDCDLTGAQFDAYGNEGLTDATPHHTRVRFQDCILTSASFFEVRQHHCTYSYPASRPAGERFESVSFARAKLFNVEFNDVHIYGDAFDNASLHQVSFGPETYVHGDALMGSTLNMVQFDAHRSPEPAILETTLGTFSMRGIVPYGRVVRVVSSTGSGGDSELAAASPAPARDSGETPGDSHTPEPSPTDESPT